MPIPENPTTENIRPVLDSLPVPYVPLVRAGVVNKNGRMYTKECLERAAKDLQLRALKHILFVHDAASDKAPNKVVGMVKEAHFDGEQLNIQVVYTDMRWRMVASVVPMNFCVESSNSGSGNEIYETSIHAIMAAPSINTRLI